MTGAKKGGMERHELWGLIDAIARSHPPGGLRLSPMELEEWLGVVAASESADRSTKRDAKRAAKHVHKLIVGTYEMPNWSPPPERDVPGRALNDGAPPHPEPEPVPAGPRADLHFGDCVAGMREKLAPDSVDLVVTSIPFEELFTYSGKPEDVGNNGSTVDIRSGRFALNLRFVAAELFRVVKPGCNCCIHVQQLLAYKNQHGFMGRRHFTAAVVDVFAAAGFHWTGEFVIAKDPQAIAQRLSLHSLQFRTGRERSATMLAPVFNDYVLIFSRPGEVAAPVRPFFHPKKNPTGWIKPDAGGVICPEWVRDACGVWTDILEIDVLDDATFTRGRGTRKPGAAAHEKHVCPLQLEVIRRLVRLYSNPVTIQPDATVLDPFMGIGSTAFVSVGGASPVTKLKLEEPRNVVGFELKESYYRASLDYVERARNGTLRPTTGDLFAGVE